MSANLTLFLPTDRETSFGAFLRNMKTGACRITISTAFFNAADEILDWLNSNPDLKVLLLAGLRYPTSAQALKTLAPRDRVRLLGIPADASFHEKIVLLSDSTSGPVGAYVGSANWTKGGLTSNQEAGIWTTDVNILEAIAQHLRTTESNAVRITAEHLAQLEREAARQRLFSKTRGKHRGTMIASWEKLRPNHNGQYLLKQNGIKEEPFLEDPARNDFWTLGPQAASLTFSRIPKGLEPGMGIILSFISRRKNNRPDRLIYGRATVGGYDKARWKVPSTYLERLATRPEYREFAQHIKRWELIVWLNDIEVVDYPVSCEDYIWLTEISDFQDFREFRLGYKWIGEQDWSKCNTALDTATERYGLMPVRWDEVWWNDYMRVPEDDEMIFMTKSRIEALNRESPERHNLT